MTLFVNNAFKSFAATKSSKGRRSPSMFKDKAPCFPKKSTNKNCIKVLMFAPIALAATVVEQEQQLLKPISSKNNIYTMEEINANWDTDYFEENEDEDYENMWNEYEQLCEMYD